MTLKKFKFKFKIGGDYLGQEWMVPSRISSSPRLANRSWAVVAGTSWRQRHNRGFWCFRLWTHRFRCSARIAILLSSCKHQSCRRLLDNRWQDTRTWQIQYIPVLRWYQIRLGRSGGVSRNLIWHVRIMQKIHKLSQRRCWLNKAGRVYFRKESTQDK